MHQKYIIFSIYLFLINKKVTTAKEISSIFEISQRGVYRYIDELSLIGVPVVTKQGRNGGIELIKEHYIESLTLNANEKKIINEFILNDKNINEVKNILKKLI